MSTVQNLKIEAIMFSSRDKEEFYEKYDLLHRKSHEKT